MTETLKEAPVMKTALIIAIIAFNLYYLTYLFRDLWQHRHQDHQPVNKWWASLSMIIIYFFSTLGISDFALSTAVYHKTKWTSLKKLPGTLNAQCVVPSGVMSIIFLANVTVGFKTLIICIVAQIIGAYLGSKFVTKLPKQTIRNFMIAGLIIASLFIMAGKFNLIVSTGTATQLYGGKLIATAVLLFIYGALDDIGIGCFAPTMATIYAMGMNPAAAFPIMMCGSTFSLAVGSVQFIKQQAYSRQLALLSLFGIIGVLLAAILFSHLSISMLEWLVIIVLLYSAYSLYHDAKQANG